MKKIVKMILNRIFGKSQTELAPTPTPEVKVEAECKRICRILDETVWPGRGPRIPYVVYLIEIAETMEYLRKALKYAQYVGYIGEEKWEQLWSKWIEKATGTWDLYHLYQCGRRGKEETIIRKWYSISTTYKDIRLIPCTEDKILNALIHTKKVQLAHRDCETALTCTKLLDVWLEIDDGFRPVSLSGYGGWNNDEGLTLEHLLSCNFGKCRLDIPIKKEVYEKWLKLSLREIEVCQSTVEMAVLEAHVHPDAKQTLIEKWDSLSIDEVANAVEEQIIAEAQQRSRTGSIASQTALSRLEAINVERVRKASTLDELWSVICKHSVPDDYPSIKLAIEEYAGLATTEKEIRNIWSWAEKMPEVRSLLTEKLGRLIK